MNSTSNATSVDPLVAPATTVFISLGTVLLIAALAQFAIRLVLPNGPAGLKIKLELVLCTRREGSDPITVSPLEVYTTYVAAVFLSLTALALIILFFALLGPLLEDVGGGKSLLSSVGQGNALGLAAMITWLLGLASAIAQSYRAWIVLKMTLLDPEFAKLLKNHREQQKKRRQPVKTGASLPLISLHMATLYDK